MKTKEAPIGWTGSIPMPLQRPPVIKDRVVVRQRASPTLEAEVDSLSSWKALLSPIALDKLEECRRENVRDWAAKRNATPGHRQRQVAGRESGELRLGWEDYSEVARRVIEDGRVLWIDDEGRPHIQNDELSMVGEGDWDFNRWKLIECIHKLGDEWTDKAIARMLKRGTDD